MPGRPLVLAHQGACRQAPENTIEAFRAAHDLGADGVELDVRRCADAVLVIHHDPEVPGLGLLRDLPFAEVRSAAPYVPTLTEVFELFDSLDDVGSRDGFLVNVEIKCLPWEPDPDPDFEVSRAVVALIAEEGRHGHVVVSSFDLAAVDAVRGLDPRVETGWLTMGQDPLVTLPIARSRGHAWLHPDREVMVAEPVAAAREADAVGVRLDVWTVDDPDEISTLAAAGVAAIITNVPDVALSVLS